MNHAYTIVRSGRKTVAIEITQDGEVLVRAPQRASRRMIDDIVRGHAAWIDEHILRQRQRAQVHPEPTDAEIAALKAAARRDIPPRVAHFARLMGVTPAGVKITSAKGRFGSCSGKNSLCFSYLLMRYPDEAIDYVVVHELAHITHKDHSPAFYARVEQFLPDWRDRRALLRTPLPPPQ